LRREVYERKEQPGLRIKSAMTTEAWIADQVRNDNRGGRIAGTPAMTQRQEPIAPRIAAISS
jgi:hypothetical protein